jgi:hypothetical protein
MAHNADAGVKKRMKLNSQCINQIRISENDKERTPATEPEAAFGNGFAQKATSRFDSILQNHLGQGCSKIEVD